MERAEAKRLLATATEAAHAAARVHREAARRGGGRWRRTGAAAIDLAYVANGILDGFWESRLAPWDYAAGVLVVAEAGGVVERVEGGGVGVAAGSVIAANSVEGVGWLRGVVGSGSDAGNS